MNFFDRAANVIFGGIASAMGYTANWLPKAGGEAEQFSEDFSGDFQGTHTLQTARVFYSDDTEKYLLGKNNYDLSRWRMEYKLGDFPGLKESIDKNNKEYVFILIDDVNRRFFIRRVDTKFDGRTLVAFLTPKRDEDE